MEKINDFEAFFRRVQNLGIKNQTELADVLKVTPGAITEGKRKGTFPGIWAVKISKKYKIDMDWVFGVEIKESQESKRIEFHLIRESMLEIQELRHRIEKLERSYPLNEQTNDGTVTYGEVDASIKKLEKGITEWDEESAKNIISILTKYRDSLAVKVYATGKAVGRTKS